MITVSMLFHNGIGLAMNFHLSRTTLAVTKVIAPRLQSSLIANFATDTKFPIMKSQIKADICWKAAYETIEKNDIPGFKSLIVELYPEHFEKQNKEVVHRDLLFKTVFEGNIDMAKLLLEAGANPNTENYSWVFKVTPLMKAIANHRMDIAKILIAYGANLNKVNVDNSTALHYAVNCRNTQAVELLMNLGVDQTIKSKIYKGDGVYTYVTPYELAVGELKYYEKEKHKKFIEAYRNIASILQSKD